MAILRRDVQEVRALLHRCPSLLQERNLLSQTPFHLAAANLPILQVLVESYDDRPFGLKHDDLGTSVVHYAMHFSGRICLNGTSWKACSNCPCLGPLKLLLAHGFCYVTIDFVVEDFYYSSHSCRLAVIETLKSRRERLKDIARHSLSPADIRRYKLDAPQVLDYWLSEVLDVLDREGISIPARLMKEMFGPRHDTVYHLLAVYGGKLTHCMAECLYQHNFLDIDHPGIMGHTPLMQCVLKKPDLDYILWLVMHGADISKPVPNHASRKDKFECNSQLTIAHMISLPWDYELGPGLEPSEMAALQQLCTMVAPMKVHDQCRCGCVDKGCHTLKRLFQGVWIKSYSGSLGNTVYSSHEAAARLSRILQETSVDFSQWEHSCISALRIFTFETLGLRHTCCQLYYRARYSPDEVSDIQDEDREGLDLLEDLMGVFTEEYRRRGLSLEEFLTSCWATRMAEVQAETEAARLTEEERRDAERLGVKWDTSDDEEEVGEVEVEDRSSLEYWVKRLDEVAPL